MEQQLQKTPFLVGSEYTNADVSLYAYTYVAHEGGFDLAVFPAIREWMLRIQQQPGHVSMEQFQ